eukprot:7376668-Prymnesium_polylepis.1
MPPDASLHAGEQWSLTSEERTKLAEPRTSCPRCVCRARLIAEPQCSGAGQTWQCCGRGNAVRSKVA